MSLDDTQLHVLSISGTPKQREYANKIKPIRKNGHLLLVTLLLANMIVNETLPIISERVLGGGIQSVVISTVLIIMLVHIFHLLWKLCLIPFSVSPKSFLNLFAPAMVYTSARKWPVPPKF